MTKGKKETGNINVGEKHVDFEAFMREAGLLEVRGTRGVYAPNCLEFKFKFILSNQDYDLNDMCINCVNDLFVKKN